MADALSIHQKIKLKIERFAENGDGIGSWFGKPVYVPFVIPGEEILVRVTENRRNFARGRIREIISSSSKRVHAPCPYYDVCGSCQWQHIGYPHQVKFKRAAILNELEKAGSLRDVKVKETKVSETIYGYRNKIQQPVCLKHGKIVTGFYYPGTHRLVPIEKCLVQNPTANAIMDHLLEILRRLKIEPYNEILHQGILRHIFIRVGQNTQEVLLMLVVNAEDFPQGRLIAGEMMEFFPQIVSVIQNINIQKTNIILGKEQLLLGGRGYIYEVVNGVKFRISPNSFFQVNAFQTGQIVETVKTYADLGDDDQLADVFSGVGLIGLSMASRVKKVYVIESNLEAIEDGRASLEINGLRNTDFISSDALSGLKSLGEKNIHPRIIVLDPPRQGCGAEILREVVHLRPEKVIYVSCDPKTLVSDLKVLAELDYQTLEIQPIDLFPHTFHIESVAKIERKLW